MRRSSQHQRHRTGGIFEITGQLNVPIILSPTSNDLLSFCCMCCVKKVNKLTNRPVVSLLGTRVSGTSSKVVSQCIYLKPLPSTNHKRFFCNQWDLSTHGSGEKSLSETNRPGLISTVSPDLPQSTHRLVEEDTLGGIFFLRLKTSHLRPKNRLLNRRYYPLMWVRTQLFKTAWTYKLKVKVPDGLSITLDLSVDLNLWCDGMATTPRTNRERNLHSSKKSLCLLWIDEVKTKIKPIYECRCNGRLQTKRFNLRASHTLGWSWNWNT